MADLITAEGKYDTLAIASVVADRWEAQQGFLAQFQGSVLADWRRRLWDQITEKAAQEASLAQTTWFLDHVPTIYTAKEEKELAAISARQNRLPIYAHAEFQSLTWARQKIAAEARERTWSAYAKKHGIARDCDAAMVAVPDYLLADPMLVAAE